MTATRLLSLAGLTLVVGCDGSGGETPGSVTTLLSGTAASVDITSPADGDSVALPLTLTLGATGVVVVPATGQREEGKGHHHLIIDGDVPEDPLPPLPKPPQVIHLGNGASDYVIATLPPGPHRVIAVFAGGDHVAMPGVRRDTVSFIVR
ncbi:MAG: DUF4399 domain-containing protein [Gemmatimonadaceae bacterium]|nr:DUF4399 domain-containing protein [Gemmatimonadaceae bacterium]